MLIENDNNSHFKALIKKKAAYPPPKVSEKCMKLVYVLFGLVVSSQVTNKEKFVSSTYSSTYI